MIQGKTQDRGHHLKITFGPKWLNSLRVFSALVRLIAFWPTLEVKWPPITRTHLYIYLYILFLLCAASFQTIVMESHDHLSCVTLSSFFFPLLRSLPPILPFIHTISSNKLARCLPLSHLPSICPVPIMCPRKLSLSDSECVLFIDIFFKTSLFLTCSIHVITNILL